MSKKGERAGRPESAAADMKIVIVSGTASGVGKVCHRTVPFVTAALRLVPLLCRLCR